MATILSKIDKVVAAVAGTAKEISRLPEFPDFEQLQQEVGGIARRLTNLNNMVAAAYELGDDVRGEDDD